MKEQPQNTENNLQQPDQKSNITLSKSKQFLKKNALLVMATLALTACEPDDPIEPPVTPNQAPSLVINALNANDATNTISFDADATDTDGTIASYAAFVTNTNGATQNLTINTAGQTNQEITNTGTYNKLTVTATDNDGATTTVENSINLTVETPNTAPVTGITLNTFAENSPIGTIVATIAATDADGDTLTHTVTTGNDKFEIINGTDIATTVAGFDFEDNNNAHTITVATTDGTNTIETTATLTETDADELLGYTDRPDVTYTKTPGVGGGTITEDLSHLDAADTRNAERVVDLADNDPTNQTLQNQLRVADDGGGNEVWVDEQVQIDKVFNAGLGDATAIAMAGLYEAGSRGIAGFQETTVAEQNANNGSLLKLNGDFEELNSYANAVAVLETEWGATNAHYDGAPSNFTDPDDIRLCRQIAIYFTIFGQLKHDIDVTNDTQMRKAAAKALSMAEAMTDQEMYDFGLEKLAGGNVTGFENYWGN